MAADPTPSASLLARCRLVLVRTQGPINLGMIGRLCGNFGIAGLRLVDPQCDRLEEQVSWYARGCLDRVLDAPVFPDLAAAVADCTVVIGSSGRKRDDDRVERVGLAELPDWLAPRGAERVALVFGNEAMGLDVAELAICNACLYIPSPGDYPSFNLSHAVAVVLGRLADLRLPPTTAPAAPSAAALEQLINYWIGSLDRFGYFRHQHRERWCERFTAMLRRLPLRADDVDTLRGCLAQFNFQAFGDKAPDMATGARPPATEEDP